MRILLWLSVPLRAVVWRQATVACSCNRWSWVVEEEFLGFCGGVLKERHEIIFFTLKIIFIICRSLLTFISLSRNPFLVLNMASHAKRVSSRVRIYTKHACLAKQVVQKCYLDNPNGKNMHMWVINLKSKFEDDPTINEYEIVILLEHVCIRLEIS